MSNVGHFLRVLPIDETSEYKCKSLKFKMGLNDDLVGYLLYSMPCLIIKSSPTLIPFHRKIYTFHTHISFTFTIKCYISIEKLISVLRLRIVYHRPYYYCVYHIIYYFTCKLYSFPTSPTPYSLSISQSSFYVSRGLFYVLYIYTVSLFSLEAEIRSVQWHVGIYLCSTLLQCFR